MALEGTLKDFGLPDVLEFIAQNRKTGVLLVQGKNNVATLGFEEGQVIGAAYEEKGKHEPLAEYLIRSEKLPQEKVIQILDMATTTQFPFEDILLKGGYLKEEDLTELVRFKIQDIMDEIFSWKQGSYTFDSEGKLYTQSRFHVTLKTEALILEGLRRLDEWPRIQEALPSMGIVLKKKENPVLEVQLSEDEARVARLLVRNQTVHGIIEMSGLGKFRTLAALYRFLELGLVEKVAGKAQPDRRAPAGGLKFSWGEVGLWIGIICLSAALLFGSFILGNRLYAAYMPPLATSQLPLAELRRVRDLESLRAALGAYCLTHGRYPDSLLKAAPFAGASRFRYAPRDSNRTYDLILLERK
jgi:hypothetical protein